jgi:hypothetical protein
VADPRQHDLLPRRRAEAALVTVVATSVSSAEDGAGWLAFLRDLVARGLSGVALVTSDAHGGLVEAIDAPEPKFLIVAVVAVPVCFTVGYAATRLPVVGRVL